MAGTNIVPAFLEDYMCYFDGVRIPGTVDVTMPKITPKAVTVGGAGVAGDLDMPTKGQTENMETEVTFRIASDEAIKLGMCRVANVEFRGAQFNFDAGLGEYVKNPLICMMRIMPKEVDLGKLTSAESTETKITANVQYIKVTLNDKKIIEIDKLNYIHFFFDKDYLADVREMLGF